MRRTSIVQTILLSLLASAAMAQSKGELHGQVFHFGKDAEKVPERGIVVTCQETGSSDDTNDQGLFRLPLPPNLQPGARITLSIDKSGWRIRYPLDGEVVIPESPEKKIVAVELLPAGSKLFLTDDRIERYIKDSIERAKREAFQDRKIDLGRYLKDWAARYGFTLQDAQKEIDRWIAVIEKSHDDVYKLGLAAFAKQQFQDAAGHFRDSAAWDARQLEETQRRTEELQEKVTQWREKLVRDLRLEGDSYYESGDYQKALASYQEAHGHTSRGETPELWAATQADMGQAWLAQGVAADNAAQIEQAFAAYREALLVSTRERFPQEWAILQTNLGYAFLILGQHMEGERGTQRLAESIDATRQALMIFVREKFPEDWAANQINLSSALWEQGKRTAGKGGVQLLTESVEICRKSSLVWTHEMVPQRWGLIQNNLGGALIDLAARTEGENGIQLLAESAEAARQALTVYPRDQFPYEWGVTQTRLGLALLNQGRRTEGERGIQLLGESVAAFRQALLVHTHEQFPTEWSRIRNNLESVLLERGKRAEGERGLQYLGEYVDFIRQVLLVFTREKDPNLWAMTQYNLGIGLSALGTRTAGEKGTQLLSESVEAYRQAVLIHNREGFPRDWAMFQNELGFALRMLGRRIQGDRGVQLLAEAAEANRQALLVFTREQFPQEWATTQKNLGYSLTDQGRRTKGEPGAQLLAEALQALRSAREIFSYEKSPNEWTSSKTEEAEALLLLDRNQEAAQGLSDVLSKNPDDAWVASFLANVLNNHLFEYRQALSVSRQSLARHPEDLGARYQEIQALFATGAYSDCQGKSASMQKTTNPSPRQQMALLGYELAAGVAAGSPDSSAVLEKLIDEVNSQPSDFRTYFTFPGTLHTLQEHPDLPHRDWLVRLFQSLEAQDRDSMLQGLQNLQAEQDSSLGLEQITAMAAPACREKDHLTTFERQVLASPQSCFILRIN